MRKFTCCVLLLGLMNPGLPAGAAEVPWSRIFNDLQREIREETIALTRERGEIADARRELAGELAQREARLNALRAEVERARRAQRQDVEAAQRQRQELRAARERESEIRALLRESRRSIEAQLSLAAAAPHQETLGRIDAALAQEGMEAATLAASTLLELLQQVHAQLGTPQRLPAQAVQPDGLALSGTTLHLGPLSWFQADAGPMGLLLNRPGDLLPGLHALQHAGLNNWFSEQSAEIPFDFSEGRALEMLAAERPWTERLQDGGLTMIPLLLTAAASVLLIAWKTIALLGVRGLDPAGVTALAQALREGEADAAATALGRIPRPLRDLLSGAVSHPQADAEELEELMHERMLALLPRLDRHLGTLAVLGGIAPLLGLLGTVTGMIHTFELVTLFGSGNERILSQGISEALVTTMSGLIIAVPVLLAHAFLSRRVRVILGELEQSIAAFIHARTRGGASL